MSSPEENAANPRDIDQRPWAMRQRWSRLLFAHWPVPAGDVQRRLPAGLRVDTFDGRAWLGVVPFLMDRVRLRVPLTSPTGPERVLAIPTARAFPELNLRTYVTAPDGRAGVYFFSLDAGSLLAVAGARVGFGLPYFWARMGMREENDGTIHYTSRRLLGGEVRFDARYRSLGRPSRQDDLRRFLTERYGLYVRRFGAVQCGRIAHAPWTLEDAEAEFARNNLAGSFGFTLPDCAPLLHYAPETHMQAWWPQRVR